MPGANCSIYGCGTGRKQTGISIFRIPAKDDDLSTKTREAWVRIVTRDREIDSSLRKQIEQRFELFIFVKDTFKRTSSKHVSSARCKS